MKFAAFQSASSKPDPGFPSITKAAWAEADGSLVQAATAYRYLCRKKGKPIDLNHAAVLESVDTIVQTPGFQDRVVQLEQMRLEFLDGLKQGDAEARDCLHLPGAYRLQAPVKPTSFRDFYAFETHVKTCRRNRGLEMVPQWYEFPVFYFSNVAAIRGPEAPVWAPLGCSELDFELEIACVIAEGGNSLSVQEAESLIAGYVILNDWSARDIQRNEVTVGLGPAKGKDFATSIGPFLVTPNELEANKIKGPNGARFDLSMSASVNGRKVSEGNFKDIHYTFAEMIERASRDVQLMPGDLIGSGTVGSGCILEIGAKIQPWLQPGDRVELSIEHLGTLGTPVIANPRDPAGKLESDSLL